jgi:hypothetical protein
MLLLINHLRGTKLLQVGTVVIGVHLSVFTRTCWVLHKEGVPMFWGSYKKTKSLWFMPQLNARLGC